MHQIKCMYMYLDNRKPVNRGLRLTLVTSIVPVSKQTGGLQYKQGVEGLCKGGG